MTIDIFKMLKTSGKDTFDTSSIGGVLSLKIYPLQ